MCGITGYYNLGGASADPFVVQQMLDVQRHRGPDDQGMQLFSLRSGQSCAVRPGRAEPARRPLEGAVGCNRLAVLDLSRRARQPMSNPEGTAFIAFNGAIYNASEQRKALEAAGFVFRSRSDTEVLLHLYEHVGFAEMLNRIEGMFGLCIVDLRRREINLARDPFGIKPLYWVQQGQTFLFSSEVKSFLVHPEFTPEVDMEALDEYLAFRYCAGERFLLRGVRQLKPGHWLRLTPEGRQVMSYWQIPDCPDKRDIARDRAVETLDVLLADSVASRLKADVKVGCQLSGGIDSSLVTRYASGHSSAGIDTFSIIFREAAYSEEQWVTQAAAAGRSHRFLLEETHFFDRLIPATWHLDQPLSLPNAIGLYMLAEQARPHATILLSGEGADELFGGYTRFYEAALRQRFRPWLPVLGRMPGLRRRLPHRLRGGETEADAFIKASRAFSCGRLSQLRPEMDWRQVLAPRRAIFDQGESDELSNCMKYDMQTYMVDLLVRQDKMMMAHSIETRVPFLDRRLVSFVRSLPVEHLVGSRMLTAGGPARNTKILPKELAHRTFGEAFAYRPKSGFHLPLETYFAGARFREMMEDVLLPGMKRRGWLRAQTVRDWWENRNAAPRKMASRLWIPMALEVWAQLFLDRSPRRALSQATERCVRL